MLKKQKFGVEIELTGITRITAAKIIAEFFDSSISDITNYTYQTLEIKDSKSRIWKVMKDGSIRTECSNGLTANFEYSVEIVTPPLKYDDIELLQAIVRKIREAGGKTNNSCGIHIHIDGSNHSPNTIKNLLEFVSARQDLIYKALEVGEARQSKYCKKINDSLVNQIKHSKALDEIFIKNTWYSRYNDDYSGGVSDNHYNSTRYHGINLHSYFTKGTIEFRLFNSTLHAGKIKAYIQFCLALSAWALNTTGRIYFKKTKDYTPVQNVTIMRNILINRLNLKGNEFKTCRLHLMNPLKKLAGINAVA